LGHFNNCVEVGLLSSASCKPVQDAAEVGLGFGEVAPAVFRASDLDRFEYAANVGKFMATTIRKEAAEALREMLSYRI